MIIVQVEQAPPVVEPELPPVAVIEYGVGLTLVGTDGTSWDLADGPVYALAGTSGLGAPDADHWWREAAAFDGSSHLGVRVPQREVTLPVQVQVQDALEWARIDRALWKGLDPRGECRLIVTTPEATSRYLPLRYVNGGNVDLEIDPYIMGESVYPLAFTAGDPYWLGAEVSVLYVAINDAALFPGPPFNINPSNTISHSTVANPGDEPAWPRWDITGPYTAATVGVGGSVVTLSTPILAGESRTIDMDPRRRTVTTGTGADAWLEVTEATFAPIPPGDAVDLDLDLTGSGTGTSVELTFDPRYRRAW